VDRNVIRIAVYEITHELAPPVAVIDAAVELAREFGGEHSPAFVNAVLDRWWKDRGGKR
jgi:N utilization substance protein B